MHESTESISSVKTKLASKILKLQTEPIGGIEDPLCNEYITGANVCKCYYLKIEILPSSRKHLHGKELFFFAQIPSEIISDSRRLIETSFYY